MSKKLETLVKVGYPFLVLKVEAPKTVIENTLKPYYNKKIPLEKFLEALRNIDKNKEILVSTSFAPSYWWEPGSYGLYVWAENTIKDAFGKNAKVLVLPLKGYDRLMWIYNGLGIVSNRKEITDHVLEYSEPVVIALIVPFIPRRLAVFEKINKSIRAYSSFPDVQRILLEHGFRRLNAYAFEKNYESLSEIADDLSKIRHEIEKKMAYAFMLGNLDKIVKELAGIKISV